MLKPNSLTSLRNPSSSSGYLFQNLIQPKIAVAETKDRKSSENDILIQNRTSKEGIHNLKKSKRVQKLAEEVASLLADEQGLITKFESGKHCLFSITCNK